MRDVAKRVGISLASLQYHYPDKATLIDAFVQQTINVYRERMVAAMAARTGGDRFKTVVRFAVEETIKHGQDGLLAMIDARSRHDEAARRSMAQFMRSYLELFRKVVAEDGPELSAEEALTAATLAVSMIEGLANTLDSAVVLGADPSELSLAVADAASALPKLIIRLRPA